MWLPHPLLASFDALIGVSGSFACCVAGTLGTFALEASAPTASLREILLERVSAEPLNLVATLIFACAVLHTFCAPLFARLAQRLEESHHLRWLESEESAAEGAEEPVSFVAVFMHYLGEIEAVFGLWAIPLMAAVAFNRGWAEAKQFLEGVAHFDEAVFVVVVMAIASTQPILYVGERLLSMVASLGGNKPKAWWFSILVVGPLLGSLITEPAAMTICSLLLAQHFFRYRPSKRLAYATVALLFCNVSIGGVLTNFAAPPVLMVIPSWGWDSSDMLWTFGIRAVAALGTGTILYATLLRRDLAALQARASDSEASDPLYERTVPTGVVVGNLLFLAWTVTHSGSPRLLIVGLLFFLAFVDATRHFQRAVSLRAPLLVGFFLAGLVIHGSFQTWWIESVLERVSDIPLFFTTLGLSAFNDNASITYLASLVPNSTEEVRYIVMSGAIAGGGLTIIANAPNPIGNSILSRFFDGGLSQFALLVSALVPVLINVIFFLVLR